ncbi:competence/damage-inducible protein A [Paenibacillus sp.]|uniref:competence/damage-inducible protein A n=1 Tax=Paenibacillus sp. TaxID=58172 RepID=UPI002D2D150D|nr:competence/damage-inducible protein A [Paenibacillus sp.]HZG57352.1 competence/damage-inducible protein A [Paenibacillus sp.]
MKAEIVAVGTELLLGQIVNTNAQYLAEQCAAIGIDVHYQTVVGDNVERIVSALSIAAGRADVVLCTGGLGPTLDDVTRDALGRYVGAELVMDAEGLRKIEAYFAARGAVMVESNRRQALTLAGADVLPNDTGMAVGTALRHEGKLYVLLPGPPRELKPMFERYARAWLRANMDGVQPLFSKSLKFAGIGESGLEHALLDLIERQEDPTIAPYAKEGEVLIRLTSRAATEAEAFAKMAGTEAEIRRRVGDHLYADEDVSLDAVIVRLLRERGATLAAAESCTGGMFADMATSHPGSSEAFLGGVVCYTNGAKRVLLSVPPELLEGENAPGAVSAETAAAMAEGARARLGATFAVSFTGVAGPSPSEGKPPGLVYMGVAEEGKPTETRELKLSGSREIVKLRACRAGFYELWKRLR